MVLFENPSGQNHSRLAWEVCSTHQVTRALPIINRVDVKKKKNVASIAEAQSVNVMKAQSADVAKAQLADVVEAKSASGMGTKLANGAPVTRRRV